MTEDDLKKNHNLVLPIYRLRRKPLPYTRQQGLWLKKKKRFKENGGWVVELSTQLAFLTALTMKRRRFLTSSRDIIMIP
jgi:hypothetical protein